MIKEFITSENAELQTVAKRCNAALLKYAKEMQGKADSRGFSALIKCTHFLVLLTMRNCDKTFVTEQARIAFATIYEIYNNTDKIIANAARACAARYGVSGWWDKREKPLSWRE